MVLREKLVVDSLVVVFCASVWRSDVRETLPVQLVGFSIEPPSKSCAPRNMSPINKSHFLALPVFMCFCVYVCVCVCVCQTEVMDRRQWGRLAAVCRVNLTSLNDDVCRLATQAPAITTMIREQTGNTRNAPGSNYSSINANAPFSAHSNMRAVPWQPRSNRKISLQYLSHRKKLKNRKEMQKLLIKNRIRETSFKPCKQTSGVLHQENDSLTALYHLFTVCMFAKVSRHPPTPLFTCRYI